MIQSITIRQMSRVSLMATILIIASWISIPNPLSGVPMSLQTLWLMILALCFPIRESVSAVLLYLLLGLVGIPVFANGQAGLSVLFGPTGGFLIGFPFMVMIIGNLRKVLVGYPGYLVTSLIGSFVVYLFGIPWLVWVLDIDLSSAIQIGAFPFILGDIMKSVLATGISMRLQPFILRYYKSIPSFQ